MHASGNPTWHNASLAALTLVASAAFLLGTLVVAIASNPLRPVRIDRQITGVVTVVNADGSAFCLLEDAGGTGVPQRRTTAGERGRADRRSTTDRNHRVDAGSGRLG